MNRVQHYLFFACAWLLAVANAYPAETPAPKEPAYYGALRWLLSPTSTYEPIVPDHSDRYPVLPQPPEFRPARTRSVGVSRGRWLDNDRIVVVVDDVGPDNKWGRTAILEWNTRTGAVTRLGEGLLVCLSHDGYAVIDPNDMDSRRKQPQPYLHGPLGGPYQTAPVRTPDGESSISPYYYNPFSCRVYASPGPRKHPVPSIITPLIEGDGYLIDAAVDRQLNTFDPRAMRDLIHLRADGTEGFRRRFLNSERSITIGGTWPGMEYLPWLKKYQIPVVPKSDHIPIENYLFDPKTESLDVLTWPEKYKSIVHTLHAVRDGLVSLFVPVAMGPRDEAPLKAAGLYLLRPEGTAVKVHQWVADYYERKGQRYMTITVSPNGCRVFVYAGVLDLCQGVE